jgi:anti-anti-sigma factor
MKYSIEKIGDGFQIDIGGQLIYSDSIAFGDILRTLHDGEFNDCIVRLGDLDHIDSSGLRMLFLLYETCQDRQSSLTIREARGKVHDMLLHCRFDTLVAIAP